MSNKKIDELFRSKLGNHAGSPSPEAWARLQGQMNASNGKKAIVWMRAAAAIVLLLTAGWLVYRYQNRIPGLTDTIVKATPATPLPEMTPAEVTPEPPVQEQSLLAASEKVQEDTKSAVPAAPQSEKNRRAVQPAPVQTASAQVNEPAEVIMPEVFEEVTQVAQVTTTTAAPEEMELSVGGIEAATAVAATRPMVAQEVKITFKADDDESFLDPVKELIASDDESKKGGLGKLFASARTLGNRDILAELRDTKDELFSGNIRIGIIKNEKVNNSK